MKFNLDINKVASDMLQASASSLVKGGEQASEYASHEYAQFIEDIEHVQTMADEGTISAAEAQALVASIKCQCRPFYCVLRDLV